MPEKRNDFSKGSIPRNIMNLAVPMTAAQLVNVLYSVVDRIYLGHLPDSDHLALTGIGVTMPLISILMGFANLCGTGAPPCAPSTGAAGTTRRPSGSWATPLCCSSCWGWGPPPFSWP